MRVNYIGLVLVLKTVRSSQEFLVFSLVVEYQEQVTGWSRLSDDLGNLILGLGLAESAGGELRGDELSEALLLLGEEKRATDQDDLEHADLNSIIYIGQLKYQSYNLYISSRFGIGMGLQFGNRQLNGMKIS